MRTIFLAIILSVIAAAQVGGPLKPQDVTDIAGGNSTVKIATSGACTALQVQAASGNSATSRFGDSTTSSSKGLRLPAGSGMYISAAPPNFVTMSDYYVYVASGDTVTATCFR